MLQASSLGRYFAVLVPIVFATTGQTFDWLTLPGKFSHGANGNRSPQFAPKEVAPVPQVANFSRSGFRHSRSTLQYDQGADNLHVVERWGDPVVPYEQWRFPFRPYGSPYPAWGPPFAGLNGIGGFGGYGGFPSYSGNAGFPYQPYPVTPQGPYPVPPYYDGYYPSYPHQPRLDDRHFYAPPWQPAP